VGIQQRNSGRISRSEIAFWENQFVNAYGQVSQNDGKGGGWEAGSSDLKGDNNGLGGELTWTSLKTIRETPRG